MTHTRETRWQASELKFLVTPECGARLKAWARSYLLADPFAAAELGDGYLTSSLYFETPKFDVYYEKGSYGRAKYRVRRYGRADEVFLERKLKNHRMVAKRRTRVGVDELRELAGEARDDSQWDGFWFQRRVTARGVRPVCQVSYQRMARVMETEAGPARLTIDEDLRAIPASAAAFDLGKAGTALLEDKLIVEMKFRDAMPELFARAIEEFGLAAETVSKYKLAARGLGLVTAGVDAARAVA